MEEDYAIKLWNSSRRYHSEIQNEMLETMSTSVIFELTDEIRNAKFFPNMADETADVSNNWLFSSVDLVAHDDIISAIQ